MGELEEEMPFPAGGKVIFSGFMKPSDSHEDKPIDSHEDTPNSQKTEKTLPESVVSDSSDEGVDIPHFLQPLLGMDFMPFVQSTGSRGTISKNSPEPSPKGEVLQPNTSAIAVVTDEPREEQIAEEDLDGYAQEYAEIVKAAKRKKKKKKLIRLIRKSLGGKSKASSKSEEEDVEPSEEVNLSMSTCESFSLQSLDGDCDDASVVTSEFLNSSNLDTSIDCSVSSTTSKKNTGRSFFKRKGKKSKAASTNNETSIAAHTSGHSGAEGTLKWLKTQQSCMQNHQSEMNQVQSDMLALQQRSNGIQKRMFAVTDEIAALQSALQMAEMKLRNELNDFEATKTEMTRLEKSAEIAAKAVLESFKTIQNGPPGEFQNIEPLTPSHAADAATAPTPKIGNSDSTRQLASFQEPQLDYEIKADAFMRVHDLNIENSNTSDNPGFLYVDDNLKPILENLAKLGLDNIRDESERFKATRDTKKTLSKYEENGTATNSVQGKDVLVWMGDCGHKNHGCRWPVVKARGLIQTSPKELTEFMLDSSRIKEYNEMSQGRDDVVVFQQDLHTSAEESAIGLPGAIKVLRSRNKPKLLPKAIEITSLMYAKPLEDCPGAYMIVNRSIFDDAEGTLINDKEKITSEMLLGVNLIRPAEDGKTGNTVSEFNSITHIYPPGVPEFLAKKVAPASATNMIKDIQKLFD
ncbi:unnamed protein product [Cylindrotheca closterium]|uniref:START domain-containing protein n=1 Tax=Cylindrotheca closterium TaxID=2856 RepID=A0AAD2G3D5_9STRA|nr:unnamed protein product [Cylindrotheca closterium]